MKPAILRFLDDHPAPDKETIDAFVREHGSPIVEGPSVTFLYRGHADEVRLVHFVYGLPSSQPFRRIGDSDLWYQVIEVPHGSRFEYKLDVRKNGERSLVRDPMNPLFARDPFGSNSVCHGTGYEAPTWIQPDPLAHPGRVEEHVVPAPALGGERKVGVYLPYRMRTTRRFPLLVVFDGYDYVRYAGLKTILDNLIYRHEIAPLVVALCNSANRLEEYTANAAHARYVVEDLLPFLEGRYPLRPGAADRGILGASLGAVAALSTAWRHPGVFDRLMLQSGSFAFTDIGESERPPAFAPIVEFVNRFRAEPDHPAGRLFVSCGVYESLIYENRSLVPLLQSTRMQVRYVESRDGHNWENWRDRLREGLSWLFPGPLGLVYD